MTSKQTSEFIRSIYSNVMFYAVAVPGALGGLAGWLLQQPYNNDGALRNLNDPYIGIPLSIVFGAVAGLAIIAVLTNTEKSDVARMLVLSFVAGWGWPTILPKVLDNVAGTTPNAFTEAAVNLQVPSSATAALDDAKKIEPDLRDIYSFLTANTDLSTTLLDLASKTGEELDVYLEERNNSAAFEDQLLLLRRDGLISFNTEASVALTERGQTIVDYLNEQEIAPALEQRPRPDTMNQILVDNLITDSFTDFANNWYSFEITEPGNYSLLTSGSDAPATDTIITLYAADGATELGSDDDSGTWPYSLLIEYLDAGSYVLNVSSYNGTEGQYTLIIQSPAETSLNASTQVVLRGDLLGIPLAFGATLDVNLTGDMPVYYRIDVSADEAGVYVFETSGFADGPDTFITLFREELVASSPAQAQPGDSPADAARTMDLIRLLELGNDDDSGAAPYYSKLSESLIEGTYYLQIGSYWGDPGQARITAYLAPQEQQ